MRLLLGNRPFLQKLSEIKKKEMEDKSVKKPQRPTYPPCDTCGQKSPNGKMLTWRWSPRGPEKTKRPMMNQTTKENPRSPILTKFHPETNPLLKNLSQKTTFATTPIT